MPQVTIEANQTADNGTLVGEIVAAAGEHEKSPGQPDSLAENLVPIVLFLAIAVTYCVKYYFAYRGRQDAQKTVRVALERGDPMSPELLDRLVQSPVPKRTDVRRGVIGIFLGIGLGAFGFILGDEDAVRPMLAVGLVPLLLGLAYLLLWRLGGGKD
jgi:hypothetical protein